MKIIIVFGILVAGCSHHLGANARFKPFGPIVDRSFKPFRHTIQRSDDGSGEPIPEEYDTVGVDFNTEDQEEGSEGYTTENTKDEKLSGSGDPILEEDDIIEIDSNIEGKEEGSEGYTTENTGDEKILDNASTNSESKDDSVRVCDFYRDAWKDDKSEDWIAGKHLKYPEFCIGNPIWDGKLLQPHCNASWPTEIIFNDGTKFENGTLKTCSINMAEDKTSDNTRNCLNKVVHGFDFGQENHTSVQLDWIVYVSAGYNARVLWYYDLSEALINRYKKSNRRIVVATIYWIGKATALKSKEWYDEQIKAAINGHSVDAEGEMISSRSYDEMLPHRQSWLKQYASCNLAPNYKQATVNVMVVGNVVGELVKYIKKEFASDITYTTMCIGHSLGSHVCGFIGKSSGMVDKIFAIDPAGAVFDRHQPEHRLHSMDAKVVHILHTSEDMSGSEDPFGDVNFYMNGLWNQQPTTCPNGDTLKCGCPKICNIANSPTKPSELLFCNNVDCSHNVGIEFLIRVWEQSSEDRWHCQSSVSCTSMNGYFPKTMSDVGVTKRGHNECFEDEIVEVGNLETMRTGNNEIRWFETQFSKNCRFVNTVTDFRYWNEDFVANVNPDIFFE